MKIVRNLREAEVGDQVYIKAVIPCDNSDLDGVYANYRRILLNDHTPSPGDDAPNYHHAGFLAAQTPQGTWVMSEMNASDPGRTEPLLRFYAKSTADPITPESDQCSSDEGECLDSEDDTTGKALQSFRAAHKPRFVQGNYDAETGLVKRVSAP